MKDLLEGDVASETTPLLPAVQAVQRTPLTGEVDRPSSQQAHVQGPPAEQDEDDVDTKPLPKFQIALLCFARLAEPVRSLLLVL